jgi:hypothetical protein
VLSVPASLSKLDPRAAELAAWTAELARLTGRRGRLELLGPGAVAGVRTVTSEPDGLTLGFMSYDEAITRALQDLAPYGPEELQPAVLFPSGAPLLLYRKTGPAPDLAALRSAPGAAARLLAPSLRPVPGPTLLALDALRGLRVQVTLRAPAGPAAGPAQAAEAVASALAQAPPLPEGLNPRQRLWVGCFLTLEPGELLALPYGGHLLLRSLGLDPGVALVLSEPEGALAGDVPDGTGNPSGSRAAHPEGPLFRDLGLAHSVREGLGFYYPAETAEPVQDGAPSILAFLADYERASAEPVPFFVKGRALFGVMAQAAYEAETEARKELLAHYGLAGGAGPAGDASQ